MTPHPYAEHNRYNTSAIVLIVFAFVFLGIAVEGLLNSSFLTTLISGVVAMVFANYAFDNFEQADEAIPLPASYHENELFTSTLKNGTDVSIVVEIRFESAITAPHTLIRIKNQVLRRLNEYLPKIVDISNDPLPIIDSLLQRDVYHLQQELYLHILSLRTIQVQISGSSPSRSQGIYLGER
jgi:hypothetical protein